MRILLTTEGTYPSFVGGVSTWCDQLVRGLGKHEFHLLEVTGPLPGHPAFELPDNVTGVASCRLWSRGQGQGALYRTGSSGGFDHGFEQLMRFAYDDLEGFAAGLRALSRVGASDDLWSGFTASASWHHAREAIRFLIGEAPPLAEIALALNWLRGTLSALLRVPAPTDLAHTTANGLAAIPAWLAAKEHGIPLMITEHGLYLRERYLSLSSEDIPSSLKLLRSRFYRALARLMYRDADLVVSVSEFNRAWQVRLGAPVERTRVVYNGVAPSAFPVATDESHGGATVGWIGRVDPIKDLETLVAAFPTVLRVDAGARLRLFGPVPKGNEAYHAKVRRLIASLDLTEQVTFEGSISPVHHAYHAADVVALSSVSEGFPYVAIEAMMCGRPVVATRVGGVGEAVGSFGRVVDPRKPNELGAALAELVADPSLRRKLGIGARNRALSLFTLDRMYDGYRDLYLELTGSTRIETAA